MPKSVGRVGRDIAGGLLIGPLVPNVFVDNFPIAVVGTVIKPHGKRPHSPVPVMATGSRNVFAGGIPVCGTGDLATCAHPLISSSKVFVN
jgi:uncharacterized Zn-binding protein involved in type VI secretion